MPGFLFLGVAKGVGGVHRDELYRPSPIPRLPWMLFQLPSSVPPVTPGCCEPNPLPSSAARRGFGGVAGVGAASSACPGSRARLLSFSDDETQTGLSGRRGRPSGTYVPSWKPSRCFSSSGAGDKVAARSRSGPAAALVNSLGSSSFFFVL